MKQLLGIRYFNGGIAESIKQGSSLGSFYFAKRLNIFGDPSELTINPALSKVSGATVVDLVKWIVSGTPHDAKIYYYGDTGHIYQSSNTGTSWTDLRTVANSGGQGMEVHGDYIYYTQDSQIGRYGLLSGAPTFADNWRTGLDDTSTTDFAPIKAFKEGFAVGHGNKVGWWDGSVWTNAKLTLPSGFNVRSIDVIDEFLAIGTWRGTSITASEDNYVFFWDGTATTFNFLVQTDGPINALLNNKNRLMSIQGSEAAIYLNYAPFSHVHTIPFIDPDEYAEIFPGAVSSWRGKALIGIAGNTDATNLIQGVYQYGSRNDKYMEALTCGFTISTGTETGATLKIGAVKGIGNQMYTGWRDGASYGVDRTTTSSAPYATGIYEGILIDDKRPGKNKLAETIKATHNALRADETIQLGYKTNRETSYNTGTANATDDTTTTRLPVQASKARFLEHQFEVILGGVATSPKVTSLSFLYDDLKEEQEF